MIPVSSEGVPVPETAKRSTHGGWTAPRKGGYSATGGSVRSTKTGRFMKPAPPKGRGAASTPSKERTPK